MNFKRDIEQQFRIILDSYGVEYNRSADFLEIIISYLSFSNRIIIIKRRNVHISRQLKLKCNSNKELSQIVEQFKLQFEDGHDLNGYLSRSIYHTNISSKKRIEYVKARDYLLNDWGIHHLHLSNIRANNKKEMKKNRSDKLLFFVLRENDVYFIDILYHNDKNIFQQKGLLEIIDDNWNFLIERYCLKGVLDIKPQIENPKMIQAFRKAGMNLAHKINGKVYSSIGGGITAIGTNTMHTIRGQKLIKRIEEIEEYYKLNNVKSSLKMSMVDGWKFCVEERDSNKYMLFEIG